MKPNRDTIKVIRGLTTDGLIFYAEESPNIPLYSPFGHLGEKYLFLMYRLQYMNETVRELYELQYKMDYDREVSNNEVDIHLKVAHRMMRLSMEIKQAVDEMVSLYYILDYQKQNSGWPQKLLLDSIGKYFDRRDKERYDVLERHLPLLMNINSIGNAVKHSFVNSEIVWLRNNSSAPILLAYFNQQNNLDRGIVFQQVDLSSFIDDLNSFLEDYRQSIRTNYSEPTQTDF